MDDSKVYIEFRGEEKSQLLIDLPSSVDNLKGIVSKELNCNIKAIRLGVTTGGSYHDEFALELLRDGFLYVYLTEICAICLDNMIDQFRLICNHSFCLECISDNKFKSLMRECPICRRAIGEDRYFKYASFNHSWLKCDTCLLMRIDSTNDICYRCNTKYTICTKKYNHLVEQIIINKEISIFRFVRSEIASCCICEFGGRMALIKQRLYHVCSKDFLKYTSETIEFENFAFHRCKAVEYIPELDQSYSISVSDGDMS
ncbi:MAG: hypothetical protein Harvfovirus31_12 [Harvfovirus sp.]|uniref:RING-type domain-containing protein n=1 Tax=Harvfovirus sp. TaxID=2487768 RepID=A0A3G5A2E4_9VIRU|nr:MAG: hypothetical protein Harvfovirus31_12 [Harvfovirus sp.]